MTDATAESYDRVAAQYAELIGDELAERPLERGLLDAFVALVGPGARVLDAGCGPGHVTAYLAGQGAAAEGIDISPGMVAVARSRYAGVAFDVGSLLALPLPDASVDGIVAYSKLCTHVCCPVGLYQADSALLLCPCHQSTFDVLDGARPIFGPAARSLPQLPLAVNDAGEIIATDDFDSPVGPGYWDRGR